MKKRKCTVKENDAFRQGGYENAMTSEAPSKVGDIGIGSILFCECAQDLAYLGNAYSTGSVRRSVRSSHLYGREQPSPLILATSAVRPAIPTDTWNISVSVDV
jgi:hypothetical protein